MLSLRAFMFERVYLGPKVEPEHRRATEVVRRDLRAPDRARRLGGGRDVDYIAGMTDRFALTYAERISH